MADILTPQQQMAVSNRGGNLLVSAAAGSGKTKVLVDRLMEYLMDPLDPANIDEFLLITFTKAAAGELRSKIAAKLSERIAENPDNKHLQRQLPRLYLAQISTVHSFCGELLRQYAYQLDIPLDFRTADESECRELRSRVLERLLDDTYNSDEETPDFYAFVDTQGLGRNDDLVPMLIQKLYDSARCHQDPEKWLSDCLNAFDLQGIQDPAQTKWGKYLIDDLHIFLDNHIASLTRCAEILLQAGYDKTAGIFQQTIYDLRKLRGCESWDAVVQNKNVIFPKLDFPKKWEDAETKQRLKAVRQLCKDQFASKIATFSDDAKQVLLDLNQTACAARGMIALVREFSARYEKLKRGFRILDYGDLEHKTLDLLLGKKRTGPTAAADEIAKRFRQIMVDEYQDTNEVQDTIFSVLTRKGNNLFMVGDVKQSIYQFRLADPDIFIHKYHTYADAQHAQPGQGRRVMLSSNFRSSGGVISGVNHVFASCMSPRVGGLTYGENEALHEGISHVSLNEPEVELHTLQVRSQTYPEEAAFVANRILQLIDGTHFVREGKELRPIRLGDIVILLRSPGTSGRFYAEALRKCGIGSTTESSQNLLEFREISQIRSLLQVISNPRQDIPLLAVLAGPLGGFTANDLAAMRAEHPYGCIYDALLALESEKAKAFLSVLNRLRAETATSTLTELLESILLYTRLDSIFSAMPDGEAKKENIHAFVTLTSQAQARGCRNLDQFLAHLDALENQKMPGPDKSAPDCVRIMSIHKSKGLEFPVVFLCGLSKEFNQEDLRAVVLCDKDLGLGLSCVDGVNRVRYPSVSKRAIAMKAEAESVSEELRVLYVAMTRARDRLIMTYAHPYLKTRLQRIVDTMDICGRELLTTGVKQAGAWVLYAAMQRVEAGALFNLVGRPDSLQVSSDPWLITLSEAPEETGALAPEAGEKVFLPSADVQRLRENLSFAYPHIAATVSPSKQTATQRKGRQKDAEAAENTPPPRHPEYVWRKPSFAGEGSDPAEFGKAMHSVLQYICYENCRDLPSVRQELQRLQEKGFITQRQAVLADCEMLAKFFTGPMGLRLRNAGQVLREFKFSVLDDGVHFDPDLQQEKILLQGVVDCAIVEADEITVLDFKTDRVTEKTLASRADYYRPQVRLYADALERIFGKKVRNSYLYFFLTDTLVEV